MQIHGREVMCRRFLADGTEIDGFIRMLGTITRPTYCVYFEKISLEEAKKLFGNYKYEII